MNANSTFNQWELHDEIKSLEHAIKEHCKEQNRQTKVRQFEEAYTRLEFEYRNTETLIFDVDRDILSNVEIRHIGHQLHELVRQLNERGINATLSEIKIGRAEVQLNNFYHPEAGAATYGLPDFKLIYDQNKHLRTPVVGWELIVNIATHTKQFCLYATVGFLKHQEVPDNVRKAILSSDEQKQPTLFPRELVYFLKKNDRELYTSEPDCIVRWLRDWLSEIRPTT